MTHSKVISLLAVCLSLVLPVCNSEEISSNSQDLVGGASGSGSIEIDIPMKALSGIAKSGLVVIENGNDIEIRSEINAESEEYAFSNLRVGTYSVRAELYDADGNTVFSGETEAEVVAGQTTQVSLTLSEEEGSLSIAISLEINLSHISAETQYVPFGSEYVISAPLGYGIYMPSSGTLSSYNITYLPETDETVSDFWLNSPDYAWGTWLSVRRDFLITSIDISNTKGITFTIQPKAVCPGVTLRLSIIDYINGSEELWSYNLPAGTFNSLNKVEVTVPYGSFYLNTYVNRFNDRKLDLNSIIGYEISITSTNNVPVRVLYSLGSIYTY